MTRSKHKPQVFTLLSQPRLAFWLATDLHSEQNKRPCQTAMCSALNHSLHVVFLSFIVPLSKLPALRPCTISLSHYGDLQLTNGEKLQTKWLLTEEDVVEGSQVHTRPFVCVTALLPSPSPPLHCSNSRHRQSCHVAAPSMHVSGSHVSQCEAPLCSTRNDQHGAIFATIRQSILVRLVGSPSTQHSSCPTRCSLFPSPPITRYSIAR